MSIFQLQEPESSIQATLEQGSWIGNIDYFATVMLSYPQENILALSCKTLFFILWMIHTTKVYHHTLDFYQR